jgi:hypothetical protein
VKRGLKPQRSAGLAMRILTNTEKHLQSVKNQFNHGLQTFAVFRAVFVIFTLP